MLSFSGNLHASSRSCVHLLEVYNGGKLLLPLRTLNYKYDVKKPKAKKAELHALTGYDDVRFTENFVTFLKNPILFKQGFKDFTTEFKKFGQEQVEHVTQGLNSRLDEQHRRIDVLYKFENSEDLKGYEVITDSTFSAGFSSASLKITQEETGVFSGHICTDPPKDGNVEVAGFATMLFPKQIRSFYRVTPYNWSEYTHLVLKIRGDGRSYLVCLHLPAMFSENKHTMYAHPVYTRGGPYWQIVKMPLSHFFYMVKGSLPHAGHGTEVVMSQVIRLAITAGIFDGPFKLEIDYIGLTKDKWHKTKSPYEEFRGS